MENNSSNLPSTKLNTTKVSESIILMFPVTLILTFIILLVITGEVLISLGGVLVVHFYGVIIWGPAILFTILTEQIALRSTSTPRKVIWVFLFESLFTLVSVEYFVFDFLPEIGFYALLISLLIQFIRWKYLNTNNRMYQSRTLN